MSFEKGVAAWRVPLDVAAKREAIETLFGKIDECLDTLQGYKKIGDQLAADSREAKKQDRRKAHGG